MKTFSARKNKATGKLFVEFDESVLISPDGKVIEIDEERFGEPEEALESTLTEKQIQVYENKTKALDANASDDKKKLALQKKLFGKLRSARYQLAQEKNVPAYIIFEDKTLRELSEVMPVTEFEMLQIYGIGPEKYRWYGKYFLEVIKAFKKDFEEPN